MSSAHRAALVVGVVIGAAGFALGVMAALEHDAIRRDYEGWSALLEAGDPRYDAASSDRLYDRTLSAARRAGDMGWLSAIGWVLVGLAFRPSRGPQADFAPASRSQARGAVLIDASVLGFAMALHRIAPGWLGAGHAGFRALVAAQLAGLALGYGWGALASGVSLGGAVTHTRAVARGGRPPGIVRGLAALILLPFGVAGIAFSRAPVAPAHLAWVGLRLAATAGGKR